MYWASEEADYEGLVWKDEIGVAVQMCGYVVGVWNHDNLSFGDGRCALIKSC